MLLLATTVGAADPPWSFQSPAGSALEDKMKVTKPLWIENPWILNNERRLILSEPRQADF